MTHKSNDHSAGHHMMLTGRSDRPAGFNPSAPKPHHIYHGDPMGGLTG